MANQNIKRDKHGRATRTPEHIAKDIKAAELRSKSLSYKQIGEQLGLSLQGAYDAVQRGIREIPTEGAKEAKRIELAKLDTMEQVAWNILESLHYVLIESGPRAGEIIYHPDTPDEPLADPTPVLAAMAALARAGERRAKLLGLDEPARARVDVVTHDAFAQAVEELEAEVAELETSAGDRSLTG